MEDLNSIIDGHIIDDLFVDDHIIYEKSFSTSLSFIPHVRKIYLSIDEEKKKCLLKRR